MTDPIADFLARIKNAVLARHSEVKVPASTIKRRLATLLQEEGYIQGVSETEEGHPQGLLVLRLRWEQGNTSAITGIRRVSTPGQRHYVGAGDIPTVRRGMGTAILSTSRGLLTDKEARKQNVGGEVICEVW